jgi:hypothetical protein
MRRHLTRLRAATGGAVVAMVVTAVVACEPTPPPEDTLPATTIDHDWGFAAQRLAASSAVLAPTAYPQRTASDGSWFTVSAADWTSGFFPGLLWLMYERTGDPVWRTRALTWQDGVESQKSNAVNHDVGFKLLTSFGNAYRLTGTESYRDVLLTGAATLASRYDPEVGMIRSLGSTTDTTNFQVIIDNLMNLELLFWAADHGGNPAWRTMATSHARRAIEDAQRPDGSIYHLTNYDPTTGALASKGTIQGYDTESTWSRGQAWAIAGWTIAYRYTGDPRFLDAARRAADYFTAHLPADKVPYWDFELPSTTGEPRDSSAAAIAASGLLELATFEADPAVRLTRIGAAKDMLASLSSPAYLSEGTTNAAILLHGTRHKPAGSYDHGLIFGDYYFLEALGRYQALVPPPSTTTTGAPTFTMAVTPASVAMVQGKTFTFTVTVSPSGGFSTPVQLSQSGAPAGTAVTFRPNPTLTTSALKVVTRTTTPKGTYPITVTATGGGVTRTATVSMIVR